MCQIATVGQKLCGEAAWTATLQEQSRGSSYCWKDVVISSDGPEMPAQQRVDPAEVDWDLSELLDRLDDDHEFHRELLLMLRHDWESSLHKVQQALADGDLLELSRAAHTIKGMLRNLSMNSCAEAAAALERSAQAADQKESAEFLVNLEVALAKVLPKVDAQLGVKA